MNINRRGDAFIASSLFCALTKSAGGVLDVPTLEGWTFRVDGLGLLTKERTTCNNHLQLAYIYLHVAITLVEL